MTLKLGVIGTNWITKMLVEAAHESNDYELAAVYSRRAETGAAFAADFGDVPVFTDLADFYNSGIEVVYIASPNSLHYDQVVQAIEHELHVIVEKSAFSNTKEYEAVYSLLREHPNVRLFEAARHIHQPNFKAIAKKIGEMDHISGATLVYEKYSSRFDAYLAGEEPNVLTREFSAGALTDLGVYPLYAAIALFGMPKENHYFATPLRNGADGRGIAILRYADFDVTVQFGKGANSYLTSEILGLRDTIVIDNIAELHEVTYKDGQGNDTVLSEEFPGNPMVAEMSVFAKIINDPVANDEEYRQLLTLSQRVNIVMTNLRQDAGIVFPADK
ncbi:MAG TPA: Gfo/Idh/MocA family oxidoreductase [Weissella confusa]|nr:Gfo/Idh/MocA family oxidoreductase [Weissella confusa]